MGLDPFATFTQFATAYPKWHFVDEDSDLFLLTANPSNQQALFDINPEAPRNAVLRPGPYMHFYLSTIQNVTYDGVVLKFRCRGYNYACDGVNLTIAVSR